MLFFYVFNTDVKTYRQEISGSTPTGPQRGLLKGEKLTRYWDYGPIGRQNCADLDHMTRGGELGPIVGVGPQVVQRSPRNNKQTTEKQTNKENGENWPFWDKKPSEDIEELGQGV
jgi:hypothetical protein